MFNDNGSCVHSLFQKQGESPTDVETGIHENGMVAKKCNITLGCESVPAQETLVLNIYSKSTESAVFKFEGLGWNLYFWGYIESLLP